MPASLQTETAVIVSSYALRQQIAVGLNGFRPTPITTGGGLVYYDDHRLYLVGGSLNDSPIQGGVGTTGCRKEEWDFSIELSDDLTRAQAYVRSSAGWKPAQLSVRGCGLTSWAALASEQDLSRLVGAVGEITVSRLSRAKIGIVGLGGLGSNVAALLAQGGARNLVLADPDLVDASNLHRMASGIGVQDIGRSKVSAVAALVESVNGSVPVATQARIEELNTRLMMRDCELLMVATDNIASRRWASQFGDDFLIPTVGVSTGVGASALDPMGFEVGVALPGDGCLACTMSLPLEGSFEFGLGRRGSLASLNGIAAGFALRLIEDLASGAIGRSRSWRYTWESGLALQPLLPSHHCPCRRFTGIGDYGLRDCLRTT